MLVWWGQPNIKVKWKKGKGKQKMENRNKRLVHFEDNFCVHLHFVEGEIFRKDVEIFTCLDSIRKNAKNQPELGEKWRCVELKSVPAVPTSPSPPFSVLVCHQWWVCWYPKLSGLHYCERPVNVASLPMLGKDLHLLKLWKKSGKHPCDTAAEVLH